jgi:hypothetical protein
MKPFLLLFLFTFGCAVQDELVITRKYVGKVISHPGNEIMTERYTFHMLDIPEPPDSAWCYLQYKEKSIPGSVMTQYILYFTWNGTDELYMLRQNPYTGIVY